MVKAVPGICWLLSSVGSSWEDNACFLPTSQALLPTFIVKWMVTKNDLRNPTLPLTRCSLAGNVPCGLCSSKKLMLHGGGFTQHGIELWVVEAHPVASFWFHCFFSRKPFLNIALLRPSIAALSDSHVHPVPRVEPFQK